MKSEQGFSLLELIAVLVILGLVGAAGTMGFVEAVRGFIFANDTINVAEKASVALNRLTTEITHMNYVDGTGFDVASSSSSGITFDAIYGKGGLGETNIAITYNSSAEQLLLNNQVLCDDVTNFSLGYLDAYDDATPATSLSATTRMVQVTLVITGNSGIPKTFVTRVVPKFPL